MAERSPGGVNTRSVALAVFTNAHLYTFWPLLAGAYLILT